MTRVAEWWRAWIERRIPLMEPEPSRVDLLDGVGMTTPERPEAEATAEPPASTEAAPAEERRLTPDA